MPRKPDERINQAKEMFLQGVKLIDIAEQLQIPEGTVRRWKSTHKWDSERSDKKSERSECKKNKKKKIVSEEVEDVLENTELTDKQRLFCCFYVKCFNATKAYQKAYGVDYATALAAGPRLLGNVRIKNEIQRMKQNRMNREMLSTDDVFQKYMDIAFADMTDYAKFGKRKYKDPETGEENWYSFVELINSDNVDGTLISEVSKGKDGAKIKLADRMKALQWLSDHMDLATEEQKARIAILKAKSDAGDSGDIADDGFIEALKGSAAEDWADEEA